MKLLNISYAYIKKKIKTHRFFYQLSPSLQRHNIDFNFIDCFFYLPIDLTKNAKRIISLINPKKVFFVKKEIWFNYIFEISKRKIPLYLISGKFKKEDKIFCSNWMTNHLKMFDFIFTNDHESNDVLKSKTYIIIYFPVTQDSTPFPTTKRAILI